MRVLISLAAVAAVAGEIAVFGNGRSIPQNMRPDESDDTSWGFQCLGAVPESKTFNIRNNGFDVVQLENPALTLEWNNLATIEEGEDDHGFSVGAPADYTLSSQERQDVDITFDPTAPGKHAVWVTLGSDDATNPDFRFGISALVQEPVLEVSTLYEALVGEAPKDRYSLGATTSSLTETFAISQFRNCDVDIARVYISYSDYYGADTDAFQLSDISLGIVNLRNTKSFKLTFTADGPGYYVAYVAVESDVPPAFYEFVVDASVPGDTCSDFVLDDGSPWHDSYVIETGCDWYGDFGPSGTEDRCAIDGNGFQFPPGSGWTANRACCTCGGGVIINQLQPENVPCRDFRLEDGTEPWTDNYPGDPAGCSYYDQNYDICRAEGNLYQNPPGSDWGANQACCSCGGGLLSDEVQPEPEVCLDYTFNGVEWTDSYPGYPSGCKWYGAGLNRCETDGDDYPFPLWSDWTANEACCVCGGGYRPQRGQVQPTLTCEDWKLPDGSAWVDGYEGEAASCEWYAEGDNRCQNDGYSYANPAPAWVATNVCCACGGGHAEGDSPPEISLCKDYTVILENGDVVEWADGYEDDPVGCTWYADNRRCEQYGDEFPFPANTDWTAQVACCACGGGYFDADGGMPPQPNL